MIIKVSELKGITLGGNNRWGLRGVDVELKITTEFKACDQYGYLSHSTSSRQMTPFHFTLGYTEKPCNLSIFVWWMRGISLGRGKIYFFSEGWVEQRFSSFLKHSISMDQQQFLRQSPLGGSACAPESPGVAHSCSPGSFWVRLPFVTPSTLTLYFLPLMN